MEDYEKIITQKSDHILSMMINCYDKMKDKESNDAKYFKHIIETLIDIKSLYGSEGLDMISKSVLCDCAAIAGEDPEYFTENLPYEEYYELF